MTIMPLYLSRELSSFALDGRVSFDTRAVL